MEGNSPTPFNDAENGGRNVLLSNLGGFQFTDVTQKVGLDQNNTRWSFSASWEDYDRDGDPDLYVAND
ncbi:VCBS repeat-containing protein, partial [bacterium]|nr:VCBS repeat-containing protein [bacterium]